MTVIADLAALETIIGRTPPTIHLKVIDHLDATALHWIAQSPIAFIGTGEGGDVRATLSGGVRGFAAADRATLRIPLSAIDDPAFAQVGARFCSLFLVPGIGETLRANGRVAAIEGGELRITVEECFAHCAKALIRSDFWSAEPIADAPDDPAAFVAATRFMALATVGASESADLSPKGDPAGCMARLDGDIMWFADRPGNRRIDSFRNILSQPEITALLIVPGSSQMGLVRGRATLTADLEQRALFTVKDRVPALAIRVDVIDLTLTESAALSRSALWPAAERPDGVDPAKMFVAHVKLNKSKGLSAKLAGAVLSVPGLMQKGLDSDYKSNLY